MLNRLRLLTAHPWKHRYFQWKINVFNDSAFTGIAKLMCFFLMKNLLKTSENLSKITSKARINQVWAQSALISLFFHLWHSILMILGGSWAPFGRLGASEVRPKTHLIGLRRTKISSKTFRMLPRVPQMASSCPKTLPRRSQDPPGLDF